MFTGGFGSVVVVVVVLDTGLAGCPVYTVVVGLLVKYQMPSPISAASMQKAKIGRAHV